MKNIFLSFLSLFVATSCNYFEGNKDNVVSENYFYIQTGADYSEVLDSLSGKLEDLESFKKYAESKGYGSNIKPGKYKLNKGESNKDILNKLIIGNQEEVKVRIKNEPTIFHMVGSVSKQIEADSAQVVQAIIDWAQNQGSDGDTEIVKQYFIPNTYNFYWATNGEDFVQKMKKEYDKVWNEDRKAKAKAMDFSPFQVVILASVVQMEASKADEQPKVAKAYLNRLKKGMKLEADPTSIYAYKLQNGFDQKIQRVYNSHLAVPSDYNTYRVKGLPPAPICLPNISAIDAVLNPDTHEYVFFCADPDRPGYHSYTNSYSEHERNAAKYRKWLKEKGIK